MLEEEGPATAPGFGVGAAANMGSLAGKIEAFIFCHLEGILTGIKSDRSRAQERKLIE